MRPPEEVHPVETLASVGRIGTEVILFQVAIVELLCLTELYRRRVKNHSGLHHRTYIVKYLRDAQVISRTLPIELGKEDVQRKKRWRLAVQEPAQTDKTSNNKSTKA